MGNQLVGPSQEGGFLGRKEMKEELWPEFGFVNQNDNRSHWIF